MATGVPMPAVQTAIAMQTPITKIVPNTFKNISPASLLDDVEVEVVVDLDVDVDVVLDADDISNCLPQFRQNFASSAFQMLHIGHLLLIALLINRG